jgi:hypothetical protein
MAGLATIEKMETRLVQLVDGILAQKSDRMDFLIGLNRLDDILIDHQEGRPITQAMSSFLNDYRHWRQENALQATHKRRLSGFLTDAYQALRGHADVDAEKLAEEVKEWLKDMGQGTFRLTLKRPQEQAPLTDRFKALMERESEEVRMLMSQHDHLLTCLDDVLKSAEAKSDPMYKHLAASIIYFLKIEGYKIDPYVKRLRRINKET